MGCKGCKTFGHRKNVLNAISSASVFLCFVLSVSRKSNAKLFLLQAYCHTFVFRTFSQIVTDAAVDKNTKDVLTALCKLYAVHGILENLGEFIQVLSRQRSNSWKDTKEFNYKIAISSKYWMSSFNNCTFYRYRDIWIKTYMFVCFSLRMASSVPNKCPCWRTSWRICWPRSALTLWPWWTPLTTRTRFWTVVWVGMTDRCIRLYTTMPKAPRLTNKRYASPWIMTWVFVSPISYRFCENYLGFHCILWLYLFNSPYPEKS